MLNHPVVTANRSVFVLRREGVWEGSWREITKGHKETSRGDGYVHCLHEGDAFKEMYVYISIYVYMSKHIQCYIFITSDFLKIFIELLLIYNLILV